MSAPFLKKDPLTADHVYFMPSSFLSTYPHLTAGPQAIDLALGGDDLALHEQLSVTLHMRTTYFSDAFQIDFLWRCSSKLKRLIVRHKCKSLHFNMGPFPFKLPLRPLWKLKGDSNVLLA